MAVYGMVLPAPRQSLPLKLAALLVVSAAAAVLLAQVLVHQVPAAHTAVRSSAAHAAAGPSLPATAGSATDYLRAAPGLTSLPAADAAPAANAARAANAPRAANAMPAANAAPAGNAGASSRPIVTIAPPSSDGIDGGGGPIASGAPGQPICALQKNCK